MLVTGALGVWSYPSGCRTQPCPQISIQWRINERHGVSNHLHLGCFLSRLFRRTSKKTSELSVTGLCERNPPMTSDSPHKGPVTQKMFPFDDVIMSQCSCLLTVCRKPWEHALQICWLKYMNEYVSTPKHFWWNKQRKTKSLLCYQCTFI